MEQPLLEFFIPNVCLGGADDCTIVEFPFPQSDTGFAKTFYRDCIYLRIDGQTWKLRQLVHWDGEFLPADIAIEKALRSGRISEKREFVPHCVLQIPVDALSDCEASTTAEEICWLLQLPLGQTVTWCEKRLREGFECKVIGQRSVKISSQSNKNQIIRNECAGHIKRFIQSSYPIYKKDTKWWDVTLDWFAIKVGSSNLETIGLVSSILLDRISGFLLKDYDYPKQIDKLLTENVSKKPARDQLKKDISAAFRKLAPEWPDERSSMIIGMVKGWNNSPSYAEKIRILCVEILKMEAPDKALLKNRDHLAHKGKLDDDVDVSEYASTISRLTVEVLLRALSYSGPYFVLGSGRHEI